jgi:uncharacterized protein YjbI with pentapeptide repeats/voltage-gated potassium channel Kch
MNDFENRTKDALLELNNRLKLNEDSYYKKKNLYDEKLLMMEKNFRYNLLLNVKNYYMKSNDEFIFMDIIDKNITPKDGDILKTIFVNNKVSNTTFKNMTFKECDFYGNFFYGCSFENVVFEDSIFFSDYDFFSVFENCKFNGCIFKKCNMEKIIITKCSLENIRYILCDLKNMIFNEIVAKKIYISDCDIRGGKILNAQIDILKFEDEYITKMDENTFISVKNDFKEVYKIYREISIKFESNRLANRAGEYYYIYKILERKDLSKIDKLKSYIYWMLCGYGERPTYALITSAEIILIFTIIYMFTGLSVGVSTIKYNILIFRSLPNDELLFDFLKSLYFSIVTFTTVGYGDVTPTGISLFLSGIEMILGVTMVGIWTATLARKITR